MTTVILHSRPCTLTPDDREALSATLPEGAGGDVAMVRSFLRQLEGNPVLHAAAARAAVVRAKMAAGQPASVRMVPLCHVRNFADVVGPHDPWRVPCGDVLGREREPTHRVPPPDQLPCEPSSGFLARVRAVTRGGMDTTPFPYVATAGMGRGGMVLAGGAVANEVMLPESALADSVLHVVDPEDEDGVLDMAFRVKGAQTDLDHFLVVSEAVPPGERINAARRVARAALSAVNPDRFAPPDRCGVCHVPIRPGTYAKCVPGRIGIRGHVFHDECASHAMPGRSIRCCHAGCDGRVMTGLETLPSTVLGVTRTTLNVVAPSLTRDVTPAVLFQMPARVYTHWTEVPVGFDLAPSQMVFDGKQVWLTELAAISVANRVMIVTPFTASINAELRIFKYVQRFGLDLYVPGLTRSAFAAIPAAFNRGTAGLKQLAALVGDGDTQAGAWRVFCLNVRKAEKHMRGLVDSLGLVGVPPTVWAALAPPYSPNDLIAATMSLIDINGLDLDEDSSVDELPPDVRHDVRALLETPAEDGGMGPRELRRTLMRVLQLETKHTGSASARGLRLRLAAANRAGDGDGNGGFEADMVNAMAYQTVDPGRQTFLHANLAWRKVRLDEVVEGQLPPADIWTRQPVVQVGLSSPQ